MSLSVRSQLRRTRNPAEDHPAQGPSLTLLYGLLALALAAAIGFALLIVLPVLSPAVRGILPFL